MINNKQSCVMFPARTQLQPATNEQNDYYFITVCVHTCKIKCMTSSCCHLSQSRCLCVEVMILVSVSSSGEMDRSVLGLVLATVVDLWDSMSTVASGSV